MLLITMGKNKIIDQKLAKPLIIFIPNQRL
jgi:hypothetical protein